MTYHIARDDRQLGQFDEGDVRQKLSTGEFLETDLCWCEGMPQWQPVGQTVSSLVVDEPQEAINPYAPPTVQNWSAPATGGAPLATLGQRLGGSLLDGVAGLIAFLPMIVAMLMAGVESANQNGEMTFKETPNPVLMMITGVLFIALVAVNLTWLIKRGQTIGKRIVGTRIVGLSNDENPGGVKTVVLRGIVNGIIGALPLVGVLYSIADILFIFGQERRCIHDLLAGTRVVQGQPKIN